MYKTFEFSLKIPIYAPSLGVFWSKMGKRKLCSFYPFRRQYNLGFIFYQTA